MLLRTRYPLASEGEVAHRLSTVVSQLRKKTTIPPDQNRPPPEYLLFNTAVFFFFFLGIMWLL